VITPLSKENINEQLLRFSTADLENLVVKFPYFHQAHLLLAKKYQQESHPKFDEQLQMAALYTQDRELFYTLFNEIGVNTTSNAPIAPAFSSEEEVLTPQEADPIQTLEVKTAETPIAVITEETIVAEPKAEIEAESYTSEENVALTNLETEPIVEPKIEAETTQVALEEVGLTAPKEEVELVEEITEEISKEEEALTEVTEAKTSIPHFSLQTPHTFDEWLSAFADSASLIKSIQSHQAEPRKPEDEEEIGDELEELIIQNVNVNLLHEKVEEETHYSKGLDRFIEEQVQKRKQQRKKVGLDPTTEPALVTETLAKLYESQHKYVKAISTYELLSLKNPEKKGLFAARIENLKKLL